LMAPLYSPANEGHPEYAPLPLTSARALSLPTLLSITPLTSSPLSA
jgi:hypothetical protein